MSVRVKVLITSSRGLIGRNLVESLAKIDSIEKIYSVDVADIKEGSVKDQAKVNQMGMTQVFVEDEGFILSTWVIPRFSVSGS